MKRRLQTVEQKLKHETREQEGLRLWLRILTCSQMVEQEIRTMLRGKFDTTLPRFELLAALDRVPDGLTMGELSRWLMVTKGNVTGIAERLSEDGYIKRQPTSTDRRSFCVTLTSRGKKAFKKMESEYERLLERLFTDASLDDIDNFAGILAKVKEVVEEIHEEREQD